MRACLCVKELQELLEARELECVKLRRELKALRNTVSLRRRLTQGEVLILLPHCGHVKVLELFFSW